MHSRACVGELLDVCFRVLVFVLHDGYTVVRSARNALPISAQQIEESDGKAEVALAHKQYALPSIRKQTSGIAMVTGRRQSMGGASHLVGLTEVRFGRLVIHWRRSRELGLFFALRLHAIMKLFGAPL